MSKRPTPARKKSRPILEHTVPQFLLKGFTESGTEAIYGYDKATDRVFKTGVPAIAAEKGFYDFEIAGGEFTIEPSLGRMEAAAAEIITRIVSSESISGLTPPDRVLLSLFVAIQITRAKRVRLNLKALNELFEKKLREMGLDPAKVENFGTMTDEDAKLLSIKMVGESNVFAPYIFQKTWLLFRADRDHPFWISDNPVTMHNDDVDPRRGGLGLAVRGVQVNCPISSRLSLAFYSRMHEAAFRRGYERYKLMSRADPPSAAKMVKDPLATEAFMIALTDGKAMTLPITSVVHLNSLQVAFAHRFVYGPNDRFDLIRRMIHDDPGYRRGPAPTVKLATASRRSVTIGAAR